MEAQNHACICASAGVRLDLRAPFRDENSVPCFSRAAVLILMVAEPCCEQWPFATAPSVLHLSPNCEVQLPLARRFPAPAFVPVPGRNVTT